MSRRSGVRVQLFINLFVLATVFLLAGIGTAWAACAGEAAVPPEGFAWPAKAGVSQAWSLDCRTGKGHRGIDIAVPPGEAISASAGGTVSFVGYTPAEGGGITVTVDHPGGLRTTYLHLQSALVSKSQTVTQGQQIGLSNGAPLHFGVKDAVADIYYDPAGMLPPDPPGEDAAPPAGDEAPAPAAPAPGTQEDPGAAAPAPVSETPAPLEGPPVTPAPVESPPVVDPLPAPVAEPLPPQAPVAIAEPVTEPVAAPVDVTEPVAATSVAGEAASVPETSPAQMPEPAVVGNLSQDVTGAASTPQPAAISAGDTSPGPVEALSGTDPVRETPAATAASGQASSSGEIDAVAQMSAASAAVPLLPPDPAEPALSEEWWWEEQPEEDEVEPLWMAKPLLDPWPLLRPQPRLLLAGREIAAPIPRLEWATISGRAHPVKHLWGAAVLICASLILAMAAALMHRKPLLSHMGLRALHSASGMRNARL